MNLGVHKAMTSEQDQESDGRCLVLSKTGESPGYLTTRKLYETKKPYIKKKGGYFL